ncbi:MAG: sulfotransferase family protein [Acidimicrobiales bacterium]
MFVLTSARAGSTLLRFILDSHPEIACPPETNLGQACERLAYVWGVIEGEGKLSPSALLKVRRALEPALRYSLRRSKARLFCDKSLVNVEVAELFRTVFPGARFICLYRHGMDVVHSLIEASPWGYGLYGVEPYAASSAANTVVGMARYWIDKTTNIFNFEEQHPEECLRLRYEDLVCEPAAVLERLWTFMEVGSRPDVLEKAFSASHEVGPSDHKAWFMGGLDHRSMGQGTRVPRSMLVPPFLTAVNECLAKLDYVQVGEDWNDGPLRFPISPVPEGLRARLRAAGRTPCNLIEESCVEDWRRRLKALRMTKTLRTWLGTCWLGIQDGLLEVGEDAIPGGGWTIDFGRLEVRTGGAPGDWAMVAEPKTLIAMGSGELNMGAALRRGSIHQISADGRDEATALERMLALSKVLSGAEDGT